MKKAYLVTFQPCTRVIVDENADQETIIEAARRQICNAPADHILEENFTALDEDQDNPYDPETDGGETLEFIYPELDSDFNNDAFPADIHFLTQIEQTSNSPENFQLSIWEYGKEGAESEIYNYDNKEEAFQDLECFVAKHKKLREAATS